jgi:cytochrome c oxidase subunit III
METSLQQQFPGKAISNGVIGMTLLIATEIMLFAGLISAYLVNKAGANWPPANQPRLPVEVTAVNTVLLMASAFTIYWFGKKYTEKGGNRLLVATILLGMSFVSIQGIEWVKLIDFGLTAKSSLYGAFFYTLIGFHGVHVCAGLLILLYLLFSIRKINNAQHSREVISTCSLFWYFVVGIWPVLYILVYLA